MRALALFDKIIEEKKSNNTAANWNQKLPMSSMVPNIAIDEEGEKSADNNVIRISKIPEKIKDDLGIATLPSENLASAQKIIDTESPTTKSKLLEVSTDIRVNGTKNKGRRVITKNSDQNEILSKIFDHIAKFPN